MIINLKDIQIIEGKIVKQCIPLEMEIGRASCRERVSA